jgi:hypothetical protein
VRRLEFLDRVRELHGRGLTDAEIAYALGVGYQKVGYARRALGLRPNRGGFGLFCGVCGRQFRSRSPLAEYCPACRGSVWVSIKNSLREIAQTLEELRRWCTCPKCGAPFTLKQEGSWLCVFCPKCGEELRGWQEREWVWVVVNDVRYICERMGRILLGLPELARRVGVAVDGMPELVRRGKEAEAGG